MKICPNCQSENATIANFCSACGINLGRVSTIQDGLKSGYVIERSYPNIEKCDKNSFDKQDKDSDSTIPRLVAVLASVIIVIIIIIRLFFITNEPEDILKLIPSSSSRQIILSS